MSNCQFHHYATAVKDILHQNADLKLAI